MKQIFTILLITIATGVNAQNWQEWKRQKKTQIKYLLEQIAALNVYSGYVAKGSNIARDGLADIRSIKNGDYRLHEEYFKSFKKTNPKIKSYWKVVDISSLQIKILNNIRRDIKAVRQSGRFTPDEITYCNKVFKIILNECNASLGELILLTTNDQLSLKDDERIRRIDVLHDGMKNKFAFEHHFSNEVKNLAVHRFINENDIRTARGFLNISP